MSVQPAIVDRNEAESALSDVWRGTMSRVMRRNSDVRADPAWLRWGVIFIAVAFLTIFIVVPLVNVFALAFSKGISAYFSAISTPDSLAAIWVQQFESCVLPAQLDIEVFIVSWLPSHPVIGIVINVSTVFDWL